MRVAVGVPTPSEPSPPSSARPDLFIVEAGEPRDRTCTECGKKTARWRADRRRGTAVILCQDCAAKPEATMDREAACPSCGMACRPGPRWIIRLDSWNDVDWLRDGATGRESGGRGKVLCRSPLEMDRADAPRRGRTLSPWGTRRWVRRACRGRCCQGYLRAGAPMAAPAVSCCF